MREGLLIVAALALLLAAGGLLLWQWSTSLQRRRVSGRYVAQQLQPKPAPGASMPAPAQASAAMATGLLTDPWAEAAAAEVAATPRKNWTQALVPGWLEGVVSSRVLVLGAVAIVALSAMGASLGGWPTALGALVLLVVMASFAIWLRLQKHRKALVGQLPPYIDAMVRLITIGNSTQAAFQLAIATTDAPLRTYLERAASLVRAGMDLDRALHQIATHARIEEMYLLASILGLGVRYGGRSDLLLERVGNFMRDREQAEHELVAMSSETRLSAWILGVLPVAVGMAIVMLNPDYFMRMWDDTTGQLLVFGAIGLQMLGAALLYRLARLS
ncbi:secretion system protein [Variovorax paradoxus]|uniref:type II secretion system F family protein n=1 Tax=Variovorax paradoxus TaxID=34073 RepID=UPI0006E5DB27|nr:secretion system protein [Variovorax paradoxus]KPU97999.1 secretion system protein [Variovorax paradoxus]KPV00710.1 secretion system protein [Variovorax paradoxus]KPV16303.1 secretion system protein [Variovorax paradoxus]KPV27357.1 secretion system protein [Variovorax paradoxus]